MSTARARPRTASSKVVEPLHPYGVLLSFIKKSCTFFLVVVKCSRVSAMGVR